MQDAQQTDRSPHDRSYSLSGSAVYPETVDVHIRQLDPIPAPRYFIEKLPLDPDQIQVVMRSRQAIRDILHGQDDRLLVIVGPCSIHDPQAAMEYAGRLSQVQKDLEDSVLLVMRAYFEKPRTRAGWKGLINDPDLNGSYDICKGMWLARKTLTSIVALGVPTATEWLDPITPQYFSDAVSWGAIGARNTESQVHRELASGLSMPVGFKNATDGNVQAAVDSCYASAFEHRFLSINLDGQVISAQTKGNPDCHLILRGSSQGPNYSKSAVQKALAELQSSQLQEHSSEGLLIDAAHGNSGKDEQVEAQVVEELAQRLASGEKGILGIMMESFLVGGKQSPAPLEKLVYGKSITDSCMSWETTRALLYNLADAVRLRRLHNTQGE